MSIADELITRGWNQRSYMGPDGSVCLSGANRCSVSGSVLKTFKVEEAEANAEEVFRGLLPEGLSIPQWNDAPERTFDEVLRVAKLADEILDAQRDAQ